VSLWLSRRRTYVACAVLSAALPACTGNGSPRRSGQAAVDASPERDVGDVSVRDAVARAAADATSADATASMPTLPADVVRRTRDAHERFGDAARVRTVGGTFVLVETAHATPLFDQAVALLDRALPPLFDARFDRHPDKAVTVLFFQTPAAYAAYEREHHPDAGATLGLYRKGPREIAVDLSGGGAYLPTLTHEVVHVLVESDFPDAPHWLNEGLATLFEAPVFTGDGGIHGQARNLRDDVLRPALASQNERERAAVRLDALFRMTRADFEGNDERTRRLHYALTRSVCAWLDARGTLWPFYRAFRDGYAEDETGERAFLRATGGTPGEMDAQWSKWARYAWAPRRAPR